MGADMQVVITNLVKSMFSTELETAVGRQTKTHANTVQQDTPIRCNQLQIFQLVEKARNPEQEDLLRHVEKWVSY